MLPREGGTINGIVAHSRHTSAPTTRRITSRTVMVAPLLTSAIRHVRSPGAAPSTASCTRTWCRPCAAAEPVCPDSLVPRGETAEPDFGLVLGIVTDDADTADLDRSQEPQGTLAARAGASPPEDLDLGVQCRQSLVEHPVICSGCGHAFVSAQRAERPVAACWSRGH